MVAPRPRPGRSVLGRVSGGLARDLAALFPGAPPERLGGGGDPCRDPSRLAREAWPPNPKGRRGLSSVSPAGSKARARPEAREGTGGRGAVRGARPDASALCPRAPSLPGAPRAPRPNPARPRDLVGCASHSAPVSPPSCPLLGLSFRGCSWELEKLWASENAEEAGALPSAQPGILMLVTSHGRATLFRDPRTPVALDDPPAPPTPPNPHQP